MKSVFRECQLFCKRNKIISIIGIISVLIFISYIITYNMPDILGIEPLYNGLYNLSIGYIATMIFYIIQTYLPTIKSERQSFDIIKGDLSTLYKIMSKMIFTIDEKAKTKDGTLVIDKDLPITYIMYNESREIPLSERLKCDKYFNTYQDSLNDIIDIIQKKILLGKLEDELIFLIIELQNNKFAERLKDVANIRWNTDWKNIKSNDEKFTNISIDIDSFTYGEINNEYKKFKEIYKEFDKFDFEKWKCKLPTKKEEA